MKKPQPQTPREIRDLLCADVSQVTDPQLLALVLATGSSRRGGRRAGKILQKWNALELAEALFAQVDGRLAALVQRVRAQTIDLSAYGLAKRLGSRLVASMELAARWRQGLGAEETAGIGDVDSLSERVFKRQGRPSTAELLAVVLGAPRPEVETAQRLLAAFGGPREVFSSLSLEAFESFSKTSPRSAKSSRPYLRLPGTELELKLHTFCRLLAAVELARRYTTRVGAAARRPQPQRLNLRSVDLIQLLDPHNPLDSEQRESLIHMLRTHPELAGDFAKLDRLLADAQAESYGRAAELDRMFEELYRRRGRADPAQLWGEPVPYRQLLAIAQARIKRARKPPARLLKVKELLEAAEQRAATVPVAACVDELLTLELSESGVIRALEEAKRGVLATFKTDGAT